MQQMLACKARLPQRVFPGEQPADEDRVICRD
jgi:hypothetical protein